MSLQTKRRIALVLLAFGLALNLLGLTVGVSPELTTSFKEFAAANPAILPLFIVVTHIASNVFPPFAIFFFSLLMIPIIGWVPVAIASSVGNILGHSLAFLIARRFRNLVTELFSGIQKMQDWEKHLSQNEEFYGFFVLRIATQVISDYISYLSGLGSMRFKTFFIVLAISESLIVVVRSYLFHLGFELHPIFFLIAVIPIVLGYWAYSRYRKTHRLSSAGTV